MLEFKSINVPTIDTQTVKTPIMMIHLILGKYDNKDYFILKEITR